MKMSRISSRLVPRLVTNHQCSTDSPPLVGVVMITYNHVGFIAQAIDSVLMQVTDFPIELLIGDDCSNDGTREVVERYAEAYPGIIHAIIHEKNVGARRNGEAVRNLIRSEYVAILEGDDYWIAPHKLQKQVDFLERNPDCSICCSRFLHTFGDGSGGNLYPSPSQKKFGTLKDILRWNYILTCTVMYRHECRPIMPPTLQALYHGDMPTWTLLAERGRIGFINETMSVYRLHEGGIWTGISIEKRMFELERTINGIHDYLGNRYPSIQRASLSIRYVECAAQYRRAGDFMSSRRWLWKGFRKSPATFLTLKEAGSEVMGQLNHMLVHPAKDFLKLCIRKYHRIRISAGALRRRAANTFWQKTGRCKPPEK